MDVLDTLLRAIEASGFGQMHWTNLVMIGVGIVFIYLAIAKKFEPLLLVPIGFGILIGNVPYDASQLPLSVYDGPVSESDLAYYPARVLRIDGEPPEVDNEDQLLTLVRAGGEVRIVANEAITSRAIGAAAAESGAAIVVNTHSTLTPRPNVTEPGVYPAGQGRYVVALEVSDENRYPELWSRDRQDPHNASVFWWLFAGVGLAGFYPPLIFLGIGVLTDFGPMLSNPKTLLLGAAAQFGIFGSLLAAFYAFGFTLKEAASIAIIGGADGPTAIFTCSQLAPDLLGAVALAAYSYMAMVPIIQPPIIKLLTTPEERRMRMAPKREPARLVRVAFPIVGFLLTATFAPGGLPLLGMLFFGNLLRESLVTDRLAKTSGTTFIDIVTILLGVTVGAKTAAANFLTLQTIYIFVIGIAAFVVATGAGVIFAKLLNLVSKDKVNPMIGAAGVSAVPMSARVVHKMGLEADHQNFLLMHAMGPNVAGVVGSAVAAGVLLSRLAGT